MSGSPAVRVGYTPRQHERMQPKGNGPGALVGATEAADRVCVGAHPDSTAPAHRAIEGALVTVHDLDGGAP
jgi:hypothetical protein